MKEKMTTSQDTGTLDSATGAKEQPGKHAFSIMVDREKIDFEVECCTGKEILIKAGKIPYERFQLNQRLKGGKVEKVGYEQTVCFSNPGIEKFMTIPLDQTEG